MIDPGVAIRPTEPLLDTPCEPYDEMELVVSIGNMGMNRALLRVKAKRDRP